MKLPLAPLLVAAALVSSGCINGPMSARDNRWAGVEPYDLLRADSYESWTIVVAKAPGQDVPTSVLYAMLSELESVVHKPAGIQFKTLAVPLGGGEDGWTADEIDDFDREHIDEPHRGSTAVTHLLLLNGHSSQDTANTKIYGMSNSGEGIVAVFPETIREHCELLNDGCANPDPMFLSVLMHEHGHLLGLVDNGIPMVRPHSSGAGHSSNPDSVMTAEIERNNLLLAAIGEGPPTTFDQDDLDDICAAGGKCRTVNA